MMCSLVGCVLSCCRYDAITIKFIYIINALRYKIYTYELYSSFRSHTKLNVVNRRFHHHVERARWRRRRRGKRQRRATTEKTAADAMRNPNQKNLYMKFNRHKHYTTLEYMHTRGAKSSSSLHVLCCCCCCRCCSSSEERYVRIATRTKAHILNTQILSKPSNPSAAQSSSYPCQPGANATQQTKHQLTQNQQH